MSAQPAEQAGDLRPANPPQADLPQADVYRGVYSQPYNEIVNPGRVWTASKYFLRRWSAYLAPAEIWLVIGARQFSYLNRRRPWFAAYDGALADAAGLNVDVYRRTVKRAIAEQEGHIAHFLSKDADPTYVVRDDVPRKGRTRYTVRLDDPLTPADAQAFARWLRKQAPADARAEQVVAGLRQARQLDPQALWADVLHPQEEIEDDLPLTVADIARHLFSRLADEDDAAESGWQAAADALHTHLVAGEIVHLEPHYFREQWLPALGPGPALLIVTLRSLCYFNEETGEIRDVVNAQSTDLARRLQTTTRTLRRWFKKLEKAAAHDTLFGPFFTFLESNKQPDQTVITTYRVNLKMPLSRHDFARYQARLVGSGSGSNGLADKKSATNGAGHRHERPKAADKKSVTGHGKGALADKKSATQRTVTDKKSGAPQGAGQKVGNQTKGNGQKVARSQTKGRPFKYYERLLTVLQLEDLKQLEQRTEQQYQHLWHISDGLASEPFAAVVAGGSLDNLLQRLGIHEPARSDILEGDVALEELTAWYLYATRQSNLDQPTGYVVARTLAGDAPPQPFLALSSLPWEQWRAFTLLSYLASQRVMDLRSVGRTVVESTAFQTWAELYGATGPERLPFGVGEGLSGFRIVDVLEEDGLEPGTGAGSMRDKDAPVDSAGSCDSEARELDLWQEALAELSQQMAKATFDAWLRDSRCVGREGHVWTVAVSTPAAREWLAHRLRRVIEQTLSMVVGENCEVRFVVRIAGL